MAISSKVLISVKHLVKEYNHGTVHALDGCDLDIHKGEVVAIIGPSGSGKSTLLRSLNMLEEPTSGAIYFDGVDLASKQVNIDQHRQKMGMVFQHFNLFPHKTVLQNITLAPITLKKKTPAEAETQARTLLERIGLSDKANEYPNMLSGGQKQRISLARALAVKPSILILDDTTSAVDLETEKHIQNALANLDFPCTKLIIAQRISTAKYADKIIVLKDGKISEQGTHEELIKQHGYYREVFDLQK